MGTVTLLVALALGQADEIRWQPGPFVADLGPAANLPVPPAYEFSDGDGARAWAKANGNPQSAELVGVVRRTGENWFVEFRYDGLGHIPDDTVPKWDDENLLHGINLKTWQFDRDTDMLRVAAWEARPRYDAKTRRVTWAVKDVSQFPGTHNYVAKRLLRTGVLTATLVVDASHAGTAYGEFQTLQTGIEPKPGQRYEDFRPGDPVLKDGLTLLVGGENELAAEELAKARQRRSDMQVVNYVLGGVVVLLLGGFVFFRILFKNVTVLFRRPTAGDRPA